MCGYPVCSNEPKTIKKAITPTRRNPKKSSYLQQPNGSSSSWMAMSTVSRHSHQEPRFCSQECQDRSDHYLNCILKNLSLRSRNKNKCIDGDGRKHEEIILLEELSQIDNRSTCHSSAPMKQRDADLLVKSDVLQLDQRAQPQHDFLEPLLTQFQSLNTAKWVDKNLNPIFSSIQIIEHPPQSTSSSSRTSTPLAPHPSNNQDSDQRVLNFPSASRNSTVAPTEASQDLNPIHELPSSLAQTLTSQAIHSNSNPHRSLASKPRAQPKHDDHDPLPAAPQADGPEAGLLEAEIIYNVGSIEDQSAIDQAMALRDQLGLQSI